MKQWVIFVLKNGSILPKETKTRDFAKMDIPYDAIGCAFISLKGKLSLLKEPLELLDISNVFYFGKKYIPTEDENILDKNWIKTRCGTLIEVPDRANIVEI